MTLRTLTPDAQPWCFPKARLSWQEKQPWAWCKDMWWILVSHESGSNGAGDAPKTLETEKNSRPSSDNTQGEKDRKNFQAAL